MIGVLGCVITADEVGERVQDGFVEPLTEIYLVLCRHCELIVFHTKL